MVRDAPKIEATLSDPLWKRAPELALHPVPGQEGKLATTVRLLFGPNSLYAAIECEEPDPQLAAQKRDRDSEVWSDDCVELYVLPHPEVGYKQLSINPLGAVFDQSFAPGRRGDRGWNASLTLAVAAEPGKGWRAALAIPYKDLGAYAGDDQTWRFNATRLRKARGATPQQEYTWAILPTPEFQQPDAFGVIEHIDIAAQPGTAMRRVQEVRSGLQWTRQPGLRGVLRLFPHPLDPTTVWAAAAGGLLVTRDDGATWTPIASASADALGQATALAVSTLDPRVICLGTDARGLFLSTDGGETWQPLPGAAADHIEWLGFCPSDPTRRTLLATHGLAAPGISLSRDLGATWEVFGRDRYLERFVKQGETLVAVGSMVLSEGKVWGIHRSGTDGLRWGEALRNIRPVAPATSAARWQFFMATLDGSILQSFNDGRSWTKLVQSDGSAWTSLFFTNGPAEQAQILAAYDPHRQGLCLSRHRFANGLGDRENQGLYVGPYVKSGASCVANANGSAYYVALNNALWVGRWSLPTEGPAVVQARCLPCSVRIDNAAILEARDSLHGHIAAIASDEPAAPHLAGVADAARTIEAAEAAMAFTVQAVVRHPRGPGGIKSVTVDASKLGGSRTTPLLDDGKHNDGEPGDGVFGALIRLSPTLVQQEDFRETRLLTVATADEGGASDTWPAIVHIPRGPAPISLMRGGWNSPHTEGPVTVQMVGGDGVRPKTSPLRVQASGPGPWWAAWIMPDGVNSAGCRWLTFYIKGDTDQDLTVHLMDHYQIGSEGFFDEPHPSRPAALIADGYLQAITPTWQQVRIPLAKLLPKGLFFLRWHTAGISLSVPAGGKPGTYHVDLVQVEP